MKFFQFLLGIFRKPSPPSGNGDWPDVCQWLLASEGGYSDRVADNGGPTNMGITIPTLSHWRGHPCTAEDIQSLSPSEALAIYKVNYWNAMRCEELPHGVNYIVMDIGVMSGPSRAIKMLQQVVGTKQDGIIGQNTMAAIRSQSPAFLVRMMSVARRNFYKSLHQPENEHGWLARVDRTQAQANSLIA